MQQTTITKIVFAISLMVLVSCQNTPVKQEHVSTENLPPIMGWASWNNYHVNINEGIIKAQADAMVESALLTSDTSILILTTVFLVDETPMV